MASFTYETLVPEGGAADAALSAYASLYGQVERKLFAAIAAGKDPDELKSDCLKSYGITGRQFNAIDLELKGKISAVKESRRFQIKDLTDRIQKAEKVVSKLEKPAQPPGRRKKQDTTVAEDPAARKKRLFKLHQKRRRLQALKDRRASLIFDEENGIVRITFGSRKLFRAQFDLEANQYESPEEWRQDWQAARSRQFMVVGCKSETGGNQGCTATANADGSVDLRLRLPNALIKEGVNGEYVFLRGLRFAHGHENVLNAVRAHEDTAEGEAACSGRVALTWRFLRGEKHGEPVWYAHVTVDVEAPPLVTRRQAGAVGVDFNQDHLAVAETDRFGNPIGFERIDAYLRQRTSGQREAILGDAVKQAVARALAAGKPIVIEKLDFARKKAQLEDTSPRRARALSALAYRQFHKLLTAACFRAGVEVIEVNPAFTSVIGAINYAQPLGVSTHQAAALVIARRGLNKTETPRASVTRNGALVPARNGGHVAFPLPARNRRKHVWQLWSGARRKLRAALDAHHRCGEGHNPRPPPLSLMRAQGAVSGTERILVSSR